MKKLPIVREIPERYLLQLALLHGLVCCGGFPLWLVGGADSYGDIDLYCPDTSLWEFWNTYLGDTAIEGKSTDNTRVYLTRGGSIIQLVHPPWPSDYRWLIAHTDLSASAVALTLEEGEWVCYAQYPEDIANRVCRVLEYHDWTDYRVQVYSRKGYKVEL